MLQLATIRMKKQTEKHLLRMDGSGLEMLLSEMMMEISS